MNELLATVRKTIPKARYTAIYNTMRNMKDIQTLGKDLFSRKLYRSNLAIVKTDTTRADTCGKPGKPIDGNHVEILPADITVSKSVTNGVMVTSAHLGQSIIEYIKQLEFDLERKTAEVADLKNQIAVHIANWYADKKELV